MEWIFIGMVIESWLKKYKWYRSLVRWLNNIDNIIKILGMIFIASIGLLIALTLYKYV